jgi:cobalt-zinc-cadmium efflux system outer membrane protein
VAAARALGEAGNIPALDVAQQQALYEDTRIQLVAAENDARQLRERVNIALGLWGADATWRAEARLAEPPSTEASLDHVEADAVAQSLVLDAARRRIDASRARLGLARVAGWMPQLDAGVAAAREGGINYAGPAVRIGVPLFNQGEGIVGVRYAELQREQARYVATAVRLRAEVRAAREQLVFARDRVEWYRTVQLPLRQQIVDQSQLQYNAMQLGVFQLLQARREQIHAGRGYVDALRDYWIARANLSRLLAGGSVDEPLRAGAGEGDGVVRVESGEGSP